jgi:hypothetical protein
MYVLSRFLHTVHRGGTRKKGRDTLNQFYSWQSSPPPQHAGPALSGATSIFSSLSLVRGTKKKRGPEKETCVRILEELLERSLSCLVITKLLSDH